MTDELLPYDEVMANYEPVVGLEVHVELSTATKMFCGCSTDTDKDPNTNVCPVCLGLPGSMPAINGHAVESAIRIGLALNCHIAQWCRMARKNYFYPDMTKNYQTSQYDEPICYDGWLDVEADGETFRVEIERAHMLVTPSWTTTGPVFPSSRSSLNRSVGWEPKHLKLRVPIWLSYGTS